MSCRNKRVQEKLAGVSFVFVSQQFYYLIYMYPFYQKNSKLDKSVFRCQGQNKIIKKLKTERKATKLVEIRNQVENALTDVHDCGSTR